jgi:type I restriction enzyme S subunit
VSTSFIKVSDMNAEEARTVVSSAVNTVDSEILAELGARAYPNGTVIFPKVGGALMTNKKRVLGTPAAFDNNIMGVVPKHVESSWLFLFMQSVDLRELANTQALPSIRQGDVVRLPIPLPPKEDQVQIAVQFGEQVRAASMLRSRLTERLHEMQKLRHALIRAAFSGAL